MNKSFNHTEHLIQTFISCQFSIIITFCVSIYCVSIPRPIKTPHSFYYWQFDFDTAFTPLSCELKLNILLNKFSLDVSASVLAGCRSVPVQVDNRGVCVLAGEQGFLSVCVSLVSGQDGISESALNLKLY